MSTNRVGMGVVGAGAIGIRGALSHLSQEDIHDRVWPAAVCDPVAGRAAAAADKYGVDKAYLTYEELLADPNVNAVTMCSPIGLHFEQGMQAIEAGKHIHFNKTMTTTVAEADELLAAAEKAGTKIVASPGMMLHPYNQRIRRTILEGKLGRLAWAIGGTSAGSGLYHLNEEFRTGEDILTSVDPTWYFKKPGGGPQYDVTVYVLHNLTGILGPAKRITALSGIAIPERVHHDMTITTEMDDQTILSIDFGDTVYAIIYATVAGGLTQGFYPNFYGTQGTITGTKFGDVDLKRTGDHEPHVSGIHATLKENHVFEDMMQLVDWIRDDTPTIVTAHHARHVIDIIESGYRAAATGQTQELRTTFDPLSLDTLAI
ncbi:MAG: Gfo/Idh/MocA family oxidoreductase [Anaerolineae bacterium]|nr:Gfo/Idh/MocA family oxidoreductase [Anaerolineae bacterium]